MEPRRKPTKEVSRDTLRIFWQHAKKYPKDLTISLVLIPLNVIAISTLVPWFISSVLSNLARPNDSHNISHLIVGIVISAIAGILLNFYGYKYHFKHLTKTYASLTQTCFNALSKRGESFYANMFTGALTKYTIDLPNAFSNLEVTSVINLIPFATRVISGVIIVYIGGAPWLALLLLLSSAITLVVVFAGRNKRQDLRDKRRDAQTAINSHLADVITNNQTMRTFAQGDTEQAQNNRLIKAWAKLMDKDFAMLNRIANQLIRVSLGLQIIFILVMIYFVHTNAITITVAIFCVTYLTRFATELFSIGNMMNQIENAFIDAAPMTAILNQEAEILDQPNAPKLKVKKGEIKFTDVNFAYADNANQEVLPSFNLVIQPGEKIGLVGPSGGGKSTITKLLLRLLDIQDGEIAIDNQNIAKVTQESLRHQISYVPQEPILFHRTLNENIRYGKPGASDEEVIKAAKQAHADDFITLLPKGYDTLVGERGVKLSGGQRQRVAIARAILKDSPILLLDEATSALDSESEHLIQDALKKLMKGRTTIVIAHRLSTIQKMDRIIVLDTGTIVEQGTHNELQKQSGLYAKLWAHQSGGFLED